MEQDVDSVERIVDMVERNVDSVEQGVEEIERGVDSAGCGADFQVDFAGCFRLDGGMESSEADGHGIALEKLSFALAAPVRWRLLELLADGEPKAVMDLQRKLKLKYSTASKHMVILRKAGLVVSGAGRLYRIAPWVKTGAGSLDFGRCTLRFGGADEDGA